jgi:flagellar hook protein FlgE
MFDAINIGRSGMTVYAESLRVISNNLANMNVPGFKKGELQFTDLFYQGDTGMGQGGGGPQFGSGVGSLSTAVSLNAGEKHASGKDLDLFNEGDGFFVMRDADQKTHYSRAGQFEFDKDGFLVNPANNQRVMSLTSSGQLAPISLDGLRNSPSQTTQNVKFSGNLLSTATTDIVVDGVKVIDPLGVEHVLKLSFKNNGTGNPPIPGNWEITASDADGPVNTGFLFLDFLTTGDLFPGSGKLSFNYQPAGTTSFPVTLDFTQGVVSKSSNGTSSALAFDSQDGFGAGTIAKTSFDKNGVLNIVYTNGQKVKGPQLALARFNSSTDAIQTEGGQFDSANEKEMRFGHPNSDGFGSMLSGSYEGSNVNMEDEFGNIITVQRAYQGASHVVTIADEMLKELINMGRSR